MPFAIELYFDQQSTATLIDLRTKFLLAGLPVDEDTLPHISLAIYDQLDLYDYIKRLKKYAASISPFNLKLTQVGMFHGEKKVVFLQPGLDDRLKALHQDFHVHFQDEIKNEWSYYLPQNWIPHCTLVLAAEEKQIPKALKVIDNLQLPIKARIEKIGILGFKPNEQLAVFEIGNSGK
ncbi:MAG: 2'-5' RNA ligase family protein [Candidatus Cloacimonetes bacterium]|nr:2'-5' RNA ligase family protein [Candidatus Cloacimonadota bacterium]MCF7813626.1 2'-5' RNA ligase family protein [Candidatus Cloacimonadota bacterium]MCF7868305.1 2'-5' RNA ligase family protein [Candidatus Cloacimonadota bacterium]MCF7883780.1 2'-5' RNA ligase family protein [Candidatus Cloacimonadota bacterium]